MMNNRTAQLGANLLKQPVIDRIRRNHGLEHATLHMLARKHPHTSMAGHSDAGGFWILGDVPTDDLRQAVDEALVRMKAGEHNLAVHPNCGTNLATAGLLASLAGMFAMLGAGRRFRDKLERLPVAASLATLAIFLARPLGYFFQANVTTSGEPGDLEIVEVRRGRRGWMRAHRVVTRG
jgi:hypothetical protein